MHQRASTSAENQHREEVLEPALEASEHPEEVHKAIVPTVSAQNPCFKPPFQQQWDTQSSHWARKSTTRELRATCLMYENRMDGRWLKLDYFSGRLLFGSHFVRP